MGGHRFGGQGAGGGLGETSSDGITVMRSADICGGMLRVMTPLYQMRTSAPGW